MKKCINILLLIFFVFLTSGCMYKELSSDEEIVIADNPVMSLIFLQNEYGYGESNRFITKIKSGDDIEIREGKLYKNAFNYIELSKDRNSKLVSYINSYAFFVDENGLQGIEFKDEEVVNDVSYSYLQNGFGEIISHIGTNNFINLFDKEEFKIIEEINNSNLLYVETSIEYDINKKQSLKKNIYIYNKNGEIYFLKNTETKENEQNNDTNQTLKNSINNKIIGLNNIKKVVVLDNLNSSFTIILTNNNEVYSVNNNTQEAKIIHNFSNILKFERVNNYFYLVENNAVYVYDSSLNLIKCVEYKDQIIGISWYKERDISYIKVALLKDKNEIFLERINIDGE